MSLTFWMTLTIQPLAIMPDSGVTCQHTHTHTTNNNNKKQTNKQTKKPKQTKNMKKFKHWNTSDEKYISKIKVVPGISQNSCMNTHPLISFAPLMRASRFARQLRTEKLSEKGLSPSLTPQSATVSPLTFAPQILLLHSDRLLNTSFQELLHTELNPATAPFTFPSPRIVHILTTCNSIIHFPSHSQSL